jgi:methylmalonyl-CoA mutase
VARRIWAKAMKQKYGADERSQMLKYHIQTSGRSAPCAGDRVQRHPHHAAGVVCNLRQLQFAAHQRVRRGHHDATEESVRRAMAIQLIINEELGLAKNENPLQGAFIIEELTDLVEEAVLMEFDRITERGGVLGAMETMYQRGKIQEESLYYETLKHSGKLPSSA